MDRSDLVDYGVVIAQKEKPEYRGFRCPQCQISLPFALAQPSCFGCYAQLTVCEGTLQLLYDDAIFLCRCQHCNGVFERAWVVARRGTGQTLCPGCKINELAL